MGKRAAWRRTIYQKRWWVWGRRAQGGSKSSPRHSEGHKQYVLQRIARGIPGGRRQAARGRVRSWRPLHLQRYLPGSIQSLDLPNSHEYTAREMQIRHTKWLKSTRAIPRMIGPPPGSTIIDSGRALREDEPVERIDIASSLLGGVGGYVGGVYGLSS